MMKKRIKNATILTLDRTIGNLEKADMLINGSTIEAIAPHLEAEKHEEYEEIDATDRIIIRDSSIPAYMVQQLKQLHLI
ncbi:hypothetical protein JCM19046_182 [Bacillus sp. JCM 19046]|nr:hypothetical protein JCM19046_182 [Bacillus sp. JCM 19046]